MCYQGDELFIDFGSTSINYQCVIVTLRVQKDALLFASLNCLDICHFDELALSSTQALFYRFS